MTGSTEIFQALLLGEEEVTTVSFSSFFFPSTGSILTIFLDSCLCGEVFQEDTLVLSALYLVPQGPLTEGGLSLLTVVDFLPHDGFTFNLHSIAVPQSFMIEIVAQIDQFLI